MPVKLPKERNIHRPTHLYLDNKIYFITGKTFNEISYFNTERKKRIFTQILSNIINKLKIKIYAWVLLDNHYHLLISFNSNEKNNSLTAVIPTSIAPISKFINQLHSITALNINKINNASEKIWYQYFDRIIRSEKDFWTRFNYIHNNPIKHGYIRNPDELNKYEFSSYNQWIRKNGKEWMVSCFAQYPVIDFTLE